MINKKLIIFGLGEQAEVAHYYFSQHSDYEVVAYTVDDEFSGQPSLTPGIPVVPFSSVEKIYTPDEHSAFVAIGYSKMNQLTEISRNEEQKV